MRAAIAAFALVAACPAPAAAQDLGKCNCDDVREIRDRWCSARAARDEYTRIASFLKSERGRTGSTRMFSNEDKRMINQKCVQEAINSASDRGVVKATAVTHENHPIESLSKDECRIEVTKEGTACLTQIVQSHEAVHRQACLWRKDFLKKGYAGILSQMEVSSALGLHYTGDTKYLMSSSEFAFEEAVSYATEMQMIADKWKELQQRCVSQAFEAEIGDASTVGERLWNNAPVTRDASGKESRTYRMYDLSNDPCPSRPRPAKSECTLR